MASGAGDVAAADPEVGNAPPARRRVARVLAAVAVIVAADQATKAWAVAALADGPIGLIGTTVELHLTRNSGSAFSTFQGATPLLAVVVAIVSAVLWRMVCRVREQWMLVGLVLVLGGALGNLVDRLARYPGFLRGHVVDFVSIGRFPSFNVADSTITVGALALVIGSWLANPDSRSGSGG